MTLTLTLDQVAVTLVCICGRGLPTHQIRSKWKNFLWTYGRMDGTQQFQSTRSSVGLKIAGHNENHLCSLLNKL